ncbi:MAG: hypothetical protein ABI808_14650 [Pseudonocardiales bacterium]
MRYLIQFPAGFSVLVERALASDFAAVDARYADDSSIVFDSRDRVRSVDDTPYAKNVFLVHAETPRRALAGSMTTLATSVPDLRGRRGRTPGFRLMYHVDGQLVSPEPKARRDLEVAVARASGLRLTPRGQCTEYWVIGRRDLPMLYLGERLPRQRPAVKLRGSLSSELASLLVSASRPRPDDVFLDPFSGTGSLLEARSQRPFRSMLYNDSDLSRYREGLGEWSRRRDKVRLLAEDARKLPSVPTGSVDVMVTDPPWGEFDDHIGDYDEFAGAVAACFRRILHPDKGRLVVLVNRRNEEIMANALLSSDLKVNEYFRILVNGHPATALSAEI